MPLRCQSKGNPLVTVLRKQIPWMTFGGELNLWQRWHPLRPLVTWYNTRQMDGYLQSIFKNRKRTDQHSPTAHQNKRGKALIDVLLDTQLDKSSRNEQEIAELELLGLQQLKLFLFAGQDSTSTSLCYSFYNISKHPHVLARLRAEHNQVLTADLTNADFILKENPHLLNQLHYTHAVIKETLRLYPPLSSARKGEPGFVITGDDGREYPTEGCMVWCCPRAVHTDPTYWPKPEAFNPDRWLVPPGHPLYPVKGAWRPFEHGPRGCIGQELAMTTIKLVLALTSREIVVRPAYNEWDQLRPTRGRKSVLGERAFQHWNGVPDDGMPCKIEMIALS